MSARLGGLLLVVLAAPGCGGGFEPLSEFLPEKVDLRAPPDPLPTLEGERRRYEYPTFKNSDGSVSRVVWVAPGLSKKLNEFLGGHPDWKAVSFAQIPDFFVDPTPARQGDPKKGGIDWSGIAGSEGLMLTGPIEAVNKATDLVGWVLTSIARISIEARIVEVQESDEFGFGIDWALLDVQDQTFGDPLVPSKRLFNRAAAGTGLPSLPGVAAGSFVPDLLVELGTIQSGLQLDLVIQALKLFTKVDVVNAPNVNVLEGHTANISAGQEVPFFELNLSGNNTTISTKFKDVVVNLTVIPRLVNRDTIRMAIRAEVKNITDVTTVAIGNQSVANPVIATRTVTTTMDVPDGSTAVLGGLITNSKIEVEKKVPVLGEIPILDIFFRNSRKLDTRNNLIFFLKPKVLTTREAGDQDVIVPPTPGELIPPGEGRD